MLVIWLLSPVVAEAQPPTPTPTPTPSSIAPSPAATPTDQQSQLDDLKRRVDDLRDIVQLLLGPIAILIGVLAIGGALGVVFSLRDQRRLSQLHELAVGSEVSSQRRTEQSYSSFLEESQKTLTLVNDTLALAREATDRAAHTMERKAEANLSNIETDARDLLQPLLEAGEFERVVEEADVRLRLESIAQELSAIEGYLLLQDIDLQPFSRFVKGMAQYLNDDTTGALRTLRRAAEDSSVRELQLFSIYWEAYLNIALGRYAEAAHVFRLGEENLSERALERVEFDRMIDDSRFFLLARERVNVDALDRFNAVTPLLIDLENTADKAHSDDPDARSRTSHEVAETRGDLLSWIAYRSDQLYEPLHPRDVGDARTLRIDPDALRSDDTASIKAVQKNRTLEGLNSEAIRAWALLQAQVIYEQEHDEDIPDLTLAFGKAECGFMLGSAGVDECINEYRRVEGKAVQLLAGHREQRKNVEFALIVLVCASRLLHLYRRQSDDSQVRNEESEVKNTHRRVREALSEIRDQKLTIQSPLQRRPLTGSQIIEESDRLLAHAGLATS